VQTAIYTIVDGLSRLIAPILPVTADELWRNIPGTSTECVHLADFPTALDSLLDPALIDRWNRLLRLRNAVNGELEKLRQAKVVGTSLEATVTLTADGEFAGLLETYLDQLPMLFITSSVTLKNGATTDEPAAEAIYTDTDGSAHIEVGRAEATKCPRCWRRVRSTDAVTDDETEVCDRCADALTATVNSVA
jgi:isoleucyl-tRNA synthetase